MRSEIGTKSEKDSKGAQQAILCLRLFWHQASFFHLRKRIRRFEKGRKRKVKAVRRDREEENNGFVAGKAGIRSDEQKRRGRNSHELMRGFNLREELGYRMSSVCVFEILLSAEKTPFSIRERKPSP